MRLVIILAALSVAAYVTNQKWLGMVIFLFIAGCALFGVGAAITDLMNGKSDLTAEGRRRNLANQLQSLPPNFNPRYHNLRWRGVSHEECLRRGEPPLRPDDYFEQKIAAMRLPGGQP